MIFTFHETPPASGRGLCDIDRVYSILQLLRKIKKMGSPGTANLYR